MGKKKSIELPWLYKHLAIQFGIFFIGLVFFVGPVNALLFSVWNVVAHGCIDWNIWKLYKLSAHYRIMKELSILKLPPEENDFQQAMYDDKVANWQYWEDHWFYATIGFDQLLHTITIILLFMFFL
jgi:hypothetical protein